MGVPNLSDGVPLTYEWLNQVADAINKIEIQNSDDSNVKFVGKINGQDIQVLTGSHSVDVPSSQAKGTAYKISDIKFEKPFAEKPWVVATVYSTTDNTALAAGISLANATEINFDATVQMFSDAGNLKTKKFQIRYIAVGKKQATN